jgi:hypothetical protein
MPLPLSALTTPEGIRDQRKLFDIDSDDEANPCRCTIAAVCANQNVKSYFYILSANLNQPVAGAEHARSWPLTLLAVSISVNAQWSCRDRVV